MLLAMYSQESHQADHPVRFIAFVYYHPIMLSGFFATLLDKMMKLHIF